MALLDLIERAINEHGSAAIMKDRLELIREHVQILEEKLATLEEQNSALTEKVTKLNEELAAKMVLEEFVECQGALFKRKTGGGYHQAVYCPQCHGPMASNQNMVPFSCGVCKTRVHFTGRNLAQVMSELE